MIKILKARCQQTEHGTKTLAHDMWQREFH